VKSFVISILLVAAIAPGEVLARKVVDPLCPSLRSFVGSVKPDETKELTFHTSWGRNFKDKTDQVMYAVRCIHNGYTPARTVCADLTKYGAVEFAGENAKRAISCLSPHTVFGPYLNFSQGDFSLTYGNPNRGSLVTVKFYEDAQIGGMALAVSAEGY